MSIWLPGSVGVIVAYHPSAGEIILCMSDRPSRKYSLQQHPEKEEGSASKPRKGSAHVPPAPTYTSLDPSPPAPQRRFSILSPFGRHRDSELKSEFADYEVVESAFNLPPDFDRPDTSAHAAQLRDFFDKQAVSSPGKGGWANPACNFKADSSDDWTSPASWGVLKSPALPTDRALLVDNPEWPDLWVIRVFRPELRRLSRDVSYPVFDNAGLMFVTVSAPLDTVVSDLYPSLARKFFACPDIGRFRLFVLHAGLECMLDDDARPFLMQKKWLEEIGYRGRGEVNQAVSQEHSYVCRFALKELPAVGRPGAQRASLSAERMNPRFALLGNMNLPVIPVDLFLHSSTLESLDLSRNTLLTLPDDLFVLLKSLKLLMLRQNLLTDIPRAILCTPSITNLDLTSNKLAGDSLAPLAALPNLTSLNLTCNQIAHLPAEFGRLRCLKSLILASNNMAAFEPVLGELTELQELDLSFNQLTSVTDAIGGLTALKCLVLTGNSLGHISSKVTSCSELRSVDVRWNLLQDLSFLYGCHELVDLRADYNQLSSVDDPDWPKIVEMSLSNNNICGASFQKPMPCLRMLDLSANCIGLLSDDFFASCSNVEYVKLSDNQLTNVPSSLDRLTRLVKLVVSDNQLAEFSVAFAELARLKILDLHGNNLKKLGPDLWIAPSLASLNLSSNFFASLPPMLAGVDARLCGSLEELYMGENHCRNEIFLQLARCRELRKLNLSMNEIYDIPDGLHSFPHLTELYLSHNQISALPDDINQAAGLRVLCVNNNRLSTLPGELCECKELRVLDASNNSFRFNVTNVPFDWNWRWNPELLYLSLANNSKLDINPPSSAASTELTTFKNTKLRMLSVTNVRVRSDALPAETTSLRVRSTWSDVAGYKVGVADWCGRRWSFDSFDFSIGRFLNDAADCLIGVFDGKGSSNVSNYLYQYLPTTIHISSADRSVAEALRMALLASNADLSTQPTELRAGSTATILYISPEARMFCANVGDTVAVLSREGRAMELTSRHDSWSRTEMDRLRSLGGHVSMNGLVEGEVELTRAVGYLHMLPYINASPSVRAVDLTEQDEFVIIGSGNLWRAISHQTAVDIVRKEPSDLALAAQRIRDLALTYCVRPEDSLIVLVVGLKQRRSTDSADPSSLRRLRIREDIQDSTLARLPREIDPPAGAIAMVFTDIRDSTVLWEQMTAPMRVAKKIHHMCMRRLLRTIGGYEVKTEGDAFMVAFPDVGKALRWCLSVQLELLSADWPPELLRSPICNEVREEGRRPSVLYRGLSVRMGVHWGEMEGEQDIVTGRMDYNGVPVIIASRVQSLALGGQTLISGAVRERLLLELDEEQADARLVESSFGARFFDCGWVRLKGIADREHVFALYPSGLSKRFTGLPDGAIPDDIYTKQRLK